MQSELDRVANFLSHDWPTVLSADSGSLQKIVEDNKVEIPRTAKGNERKLNKSVVQNALLLKEATKNWKANAT